MTVGRMKFVILPEKQRQCKEEALATAERVHHGDLYSANRKIARLERACKLQGRLCAGSILALVLVLAAWWMEWI